MLLRISPNSKTRATSEACRRRRPHRRPARKNAPGHITHSKKPGRGKRLVPTDDQRAAQRLLSGHPVPLGARAPPPASAWPAPAVADARSRHDTSAMPLTARMVEFADQGLPVLPTLNAQASPSQPESRTLVPMHGESLHPLHQGQATTATPTSAASFEVTPVLFAQFAQTGHRHPVGWRARRLYFGGVCPAAAAAIVPPTSMHSPVAVALNKLGPSKTFSGNKTSPRCGPMLPARFRLRPTVQGICRSERARISSSCGRLSNSLRRCGVWASC